MTIDHGAHLRIGMPRSASTKLGRTLPVTAGTTSPTTFDLAIDAGDIGPDLHQLASYIASDGARNIMGYSPW